MIWIIVGFTVVALLVLGIAAYGAYALCTALGDAVPNEEEGT